MPAGQYFDYAAHNQYIPNSPDTFYGQVTVQPPTNSASDSAQTTPSPVSKSRRTVSRPSQSQTTQSNQPSTHNTTSIKRSSSARGPSTQVRRERERQLANTPRDTLIQLTISKEHEAREAKHLLTSAILQMEVLRDNLVREEQSRRALEEEKHIQGVKTTEAILNVQMDSMNAQQDVGMYKLQIDNLQRDLQRAKEVVRAVENERDEAERALVRARTNARQMKEQNVLLIAREEGRREGFEEGLRQGRLVHGVTVPAGLVGDGIAFIEELPTPKPRKPSTGPAPAKPSSSRRARKSNSAAPPTAASIEAEAAQAALREIDERENFRIKMQLNQLERDLDKERQRSKQAEREANRLNDEKRRAEEERKRVEEEREKERRARKEVEREKEEITKREEDRIKRVEEEKQRLQQEKDRELNELRREKERLEREKADVEGRARKEVDLERERTRRLEEDRARERDRDRDRDREREERERAREKEKEKETSAAIAAAAAAAVTAAVGIAKSSGSNNTASRRGSPDPGPSFKKIPYLAMAPPPTMSMPTPIVMPSAPAPNPNPPAPNSGARPDTYGIPRAGSSGSQRGYGRDRRMSVGSYSSAASGLPLDMLQLPDERDRNMRGNLSDIPEDASVQGASPARSATPVGRENNMPPPPSWLTNPPPDYTRPENGGQGVSVEGWRSTIKPGAAMPEPWGAHPPVAMPRGPGEGGGNGGMGAPYTPGGPYQPNNNLLAPHDPSRGASIRRTSSGSTGSYDIHIEPPSRPESSLGGQQDDATGYFLSPHHAPQPLPPQQQQHSQPLPVRPRVGVYDSNGMDTEPNSPVDNNAYRHLPPNFIPQTLTDNRGISTPISHPGVLPGMGPVIPPPPVMPSGPPSKAAPIYGNPNRERDREEGDSPPLSVLANRSPFIPPAVLGGIGGSSPSTGGAWGAPGRVGSLGSGPGMTPATTTRDLPGGGRSGVSIYGPPVGVGGYSPNGPGPMPPAAPYLNRNHEDEEDNGFDPTTTQNTRLNATIGQRKATPLRRR